MRDHVKIFWFFDISYKSIEVSIRFVKIDGFIRSYDGTRYLVLFGPKKYDKIYDRIRHALGLRSGITYVFSRDNAKIKNDFYNSLPPEETLTLHNVIMHIKSKTNKDQNLYYYN